MMVIFIHLRFIIFNPLHKYKILEFQVIQFHETNWPFKFNYLRKCISNLVAGNHFFSLCYKNYQIKKGARIISCIKNTISRTTPVPKQGCQLLVAIGKAKGMGLRIFLDKKRLRVLFAVQICYGEKISVPCQKRNYVEKTRGETVHNTRFKREQFSTPFSSKQTSMIRNGPDLY